MKKHKKWIILSAILLIILGTAYTVVFGTKKGRSEQDMKETEQTFYHAGEQGNILIAYFTGADNMPQEGLDAVSSASVRVVNGELVGNTELAAIRIQEYVHGDLFSILTKRLYSQNYTLSTIQAFGEQKLNVKPELVSHVENFEGYDIIFLGYPAWWMDVPIAIESFLAEYDFSGKTVIPFTTHVSSGLGSTVEKIQKLVPQAEVLPGISIQEHALDGELLNEILENYLENYMQDYIVGQKENINATSITFSMAGIDVLDCVPEDTQKENSKAFKKTEQIGSVTAGTEYNNDFLIDNVLFFSDTGEYRSLEELHYHIYIPDSYDGRKPYALYITLPGYGAYYFQGVAVNLDMEHFAEEAKKYNDEMIIVAPQPNDWGETSKRQTIGLTEYMLAAYNINPDMVYISGYSGGGETLSLAVSERPELYTAALIVSSKWDGDLAEVAAKKTPIYFVIGEGDEYYGSNPAKNAYEELVTLYKHMEINEDMVRQLAILDIKDERYFSEKGVSNQHGGGGLFAEDETVMGWLFGEHPLRGN